MNRGDHLWERLARQTDLQEELFPGQTLVELLGQGRVLVEGHRGVREYSRERIGVKVSYGILCVCGSGLELRCMTREKLIIAGRIDGITLNRRTNP